MLCFIETSNPLIERLIKKLTENKILIKISSMVTFLEMLQKNKYLVIRENGSCRLYASLRDISQDIGVDYTTISKKLKTNPDFCICRAKTTRESYCIRKL